MILRRTTLVEWWEAKARLEYVKEKVPGERREAANAGHSFERFRKREGDK